MDRVDGLDVHVYEVPTDAPESDGTLEWTSTTMVAVEARADSTVGLGWTYGHRAVADVIRSTLDGIVRHGDVAAVSEMNLAMRRALRNSGTTGIGALAISAVDLALWDLRARLAQLPLAAMLGRVRDGVELYGSGGFTSYGPREVASQLGGWARDGFRHVKMKIGRGRDDDDIARLRAAREAIGDEVELFVDANGAYDTRSALEMARRMEPFDVRWFEEPVSSDDIAGLALVRAHTPGAMQVAAGEYGWRLDDFDRWLGVVDVMQADATRCGGVTGFLEVGALCKAQHVPLSAHCAPHVHLALGCATESVVHLEYFHDHARIEQMVLRGAARPRDGKLYPALDRLGIGVELDCERARQFEVVGHGN